MSDLQPSMQAGNTYTPSKEAKSAFSEELPKLSAALDLLYIRSNASGRNNFRGKWPQIAEYLFGEQLIGYDDNGTQDLETRAKLEAEAGERRIALKQVIAEIEEKTSDKGVLQVDYVGGIIDIYGAYITSFLYDDDVIERVRAGSLEKITSFRDNLKRQQEISDKEGSASLESSDVTDPQEDKKLSIEEKDILSNVADDEISTIEPIVTEAPVSEAVRKLPVSEVNIDVSDDDVADVVEPKFPSKVVAEEVKEEVLPEKNTAAPSIFGTANNIAPKQDSESEAVEEKPEIKAGVYKILFNTASGFSS